MADLPLSNSAQAMRLYGAGELGPDGYPTEWHATIKHAVRAAAGNRCVRCGHPYVKGAGRWSRCDEQCTHGQPARIVGDDSGAQVGVWTNVGSLIAVDRDEGRERAVEAEWRILTVHHLDGDKANCRWFNLMAACQRCHLEIQGKVRMDRPWPWEHSPWMRPYVAGYYALRYLGEEISRLEVDSRLDELLALGRQEEAVERMAL